MKKITMELLTKIHDYGYQAFAVGGYVRDMLLGKSSNDIDITTNATIAAIIVTLILVFPAFILLPRLS